MGEFFAFIMIVAVSVSALCGVGYGLIGILGKDEKLSNKGVFDEEALSIKEHLSEVAKSPMTNSDGPQNVIMDVFPNYDVDATDPNFQTNMVKLIKEETAPQIDDNVFCGNNDYPGSM